MRALRLSVLVLALLVAPAASATSHSVTLAVRQSGCPTGHTYCFTLESGSFDGVAAGDELTLTLHNTGSIEHEVVVTNLANKDSNHQSTSEDSNLAAVEDVPAGDTQNVTFTIPASASGLYLWCGLQGHEGLGMWMEVPFGSSGDSSSKGSPLPLGLTFAALAVAFVAIRRRAA